MTINAHTQLNIVIGNPIKHSLSPEFHQNVYKDLGINAVMLAIDNPDLSELVKSIKTLSIRLTAVTLPFKTEILKYVDCMSDDVKILQAANTLILRNGQIHAYNTDVAGIQAALNDMEIKDKKVLILGAGGSARAVAYALKDSGAKFLWLNRTTEKAQMLADQFGGQVVGPAELNQLHPDVIINATSVGMGSDLSPLPDYAFHPNQIIFDLIYTPQETTLLKDAKIAGAKIISGIIMFQKQALKQIELSYEVIP